MDRRGSRPTRSCTVYKSLNENQLCSRRVDVQRSPKKDRKRVSETESYNHKYSLRHSRNTRYNEDDSEISFDEDEHLTPMRQKSTKRKKPPSESNNDDEDFDCEEIKKGKRKRIELDDDDEDDDIPKPTPRRSTRFRNNGSESLHKDDEELDNSKPLSATSSTKINETENDGVEVQPSRRGRPRRVVIQDKDDEEEAKEEVNDDNTEKSRESTAEPRQYKLREKPTPVDRLASQQSTDRPRRKAAPLFSRHKFVNNGNRRNLRETRKRRYSSSSTSSSDEELTNAKRDAKDEAKFQRRLMRSMHQNRQNLLPINMTDKDLGSTKNLVKERLRQIGGNSCTDIDPMGIDKGVRFDQVGGLTSHLQSLKETVLFPLIYPELFETFKITPPKGVFLYIVFLYFTAVFYRNVILR
jgi:SpoVK/Ycf46/Vps4 family AAA+-type ATPase